MSTFRTRFAMSASWMFVGGLVAGCVPQPVPVPPDPCPASAAPLGATWVRGTAGPDVLLIAGLADGTDVAICALGGDDRIVFDDGLQLGAVVLWANEGNDVVEDGFSVPLGPYATFEDLVVELGAGNDEIELGRPHQSASSTFDIDTGDGDNFVTMGQAQVPPNRSGSYTVTAGSGVDRIDLSTERAQVDSGDGDDWVRLGRQVLTLWVGPDSSLRQVRLGAGNDVAYGTADNDRISGGPGDDAIFGEGAYRFTAVLPPANPSVDNNSELLFGDAGNDTIVLGSSGGPGILDGGPGDDALDAAGGANWFDDVNGGDGLDNCTVDPIDVVAGC